MVFVPNKKILLSAAVSFAALQVNPAFAEIEAPEPDASAIATAGEIIVTAGKREENIQDVPAAITAVGGDALERQDIRSAAEVVRLIPNASAAQTESRSRPRWFIRGVGSNDPAANVVNPIGVYFDEVYVNSPFFQAFPVFDLERVEVLRGPQGTLWGKNTVGGAIHYISRKPEFDTSGYVRAGIGNYGSIFTQGGFGGTVIPDEVAARGSFFYERRGDVWENAGSGESGTGRFDDYAGRVQLLFTPTDDLDILVSGRVRNYDGTPIPRFIVPAYPDNATLKGAPAPADDYGNTPTGSDKVYEANVPGISKTKQRGATLTINWTPGDYTLTSITAWDKGDNFSLADADYTNFEGSRSRTDLSSEQFTQEIRLTSPREDRFNWIVGAHYFWEDFHSDATTATVGTTTYLDRGTGPQRWRHSYYQNVLYDQKAESYAAFGSGTFNFTDALSLTLGARYTSEKRSATVNIYNPIGDASRRLNTVDPTTPGTAARPLVTFVDPTTWWLRSSVLLSTPTTPFISSPSKTWNRFTWDITPQWKISEDALLYARFARGFRSGTFQASATSAVQFDPDGIAPEDLYSYEAGVKTSWLDGKLTANLAAFYYDYKQIQVLVQGVPVQSGGTTVFAARLINAKGWSQGLELDLSARPIEGLRINGSIGLLDTKYTDDFIPNNPNTGLLFGEGNQFTRAPHFTGNIDVEYSVPVGGWDLSLGTDWSYRTAQYFTVNAQETDPTANDYNVSRYQRQDSYGIGNARIAFSDGDDRLEFQLFVRNLTNKTFKILTFGTQQGARLTTLGEPRTYGASVTTRF
ncbi:TonB-dependent receptor [Sphingomonas sp. DBB INV C78]|uniref:TonB-dependent receptor n=1 Tax=Sphingomonas sp. DBB INV C78 TaxID=3349434 RepID=UPI0036D21A66